MKKNKDKCTVKTTPTSNFGLKSIKIANQIPSYLGNYTETCLREFKISFEKQIEGTEFLDRSGIPLFVFNGMRPVPVLG